MASVTKERVTCDSSKTLLLSNHLLTPIMHAMCVIRYSFTAKHASGKNMALRKSEERENTFTALYVFTEKNLRVDSHS